MSRSSSRAVPVLSALIGALFLFVTTTPAQASVQEVHRSGCNGNACVHAFFTDANGYRTHGESNILAGSALGYFILTGPGLYYQTPAKVYARGDTSETGNSRGSGQVCAEFMMYINGSWGSYGKPCVNVG